MKIISWNVNGIRAVVKKGFLEFVKKENPDILCLQEIKIHEKPPVVEQSSLRGSAQNIVSDLSKLGYLDYWNFAKKPGYSGTAIFVKTLTDTTPEVKEVSTSGVKRVIYGIGDKKFDDEGRVLTLEFDKFYLINAYFPHTQRELTRLDYKLEFNEKFLEFVNSLKANSQKPIAICGDLNVAHKEIDLANPKENQKNAGFLPEERAWMDKLLAAGFIDSFREFTKDGGHYTWWTHWANARARNIGWRIDYFIISEDLKNKIRSSTILPQVMGSDHAPIEMQIDL